MFAHNFEFSKLWFSDFGCEQKQDEIIIHPLNFQNSVKFRAAILCVGSNSVCFCLGINYTSAFDWVENTAEGRNRQNFPQ